MNGLSGSGTIDNNGAADILTTGSGGNGYWSGNISGASGGVAWIENSTNTLVVSGTNYLGGATNSEVQGGTLILTNGGVMKLASTEFWIAGNAAVTSSVVVAGGTLTVSNWLVCCLNTNANGTLSVNSGTVQKAGANNIVVGSLGSSGTLIVNGGQVLNNGNLWLGESPTAVASLHLNGGLVQATQVRENNSGGLPTAPGVAYFNGGTLQATASSASFIQDITSEVMSNGLVLDDGGFTLSIGSAEPLQAGDAHHGGLVKQGAGIVYLDAVNTYTGTAW